MGSPGSIDIDSLKKFYRNHIQESLLPFWTRAMDHQNGGIYTCFTNSGNSLVSKDKYTWSQGRYLWLWSKIAAMILDGRLDGESESIREHLRKTVQFLEANAFLDNGNCVFLLTEKGKKKEPVPGMGYDMSIYADCFVVLGLAAYAGLVNDHNRFEWALRLYDGIIERIENGNFRTEPYPVPKGYRAHSISMILLNVSQELADIADKIHYRDKKNVQRDSILYMRDIMEYYCQPDYSVAELISEKPAKKNTLLSRHRNPGHAIESMWFVMQTAQKTGHTGYIKQATHVLEKAIETGWDIDFDGLFRFVDKTGNKPVGETDDSPFEEMIKDTWDMKLWWPHAEALYATLFAYTLSGEERLLNRHQKIKDYVFRTFPNPDLDTGEWIQIRDRKGQPAEKVVALPVKDPFHILRSLLLILDLPDLNIKTEN